MPQRFVSDSTLVRLVARALLHLEAGRMNTSGEVYPPAVVEALDQVGLACVLDGRCAPGTVPALVDWCVATPLSRWPLQQVESEEVYLLDPGTRRPTRHCLDFAGAATPAEEDSVLRALAGLRIRAGSDERFRQCRRLLLESGAVDRSDQLRYMADPEQGGWWELIRPLYLELSRDADGFVCTGCGERASDRCPTPWCAAPGTVPESQAWAPDREMRHRVVHPGLGERLIEERLRDLAVRTAPAPGLLGGLVLPDIAWTVCVSVRSRPEFVVADLAGQTPSSRLFVVLPGPSPDENFRCRVRLLSGPLNAEAVAEQEFLDLVGSVPGA